ncbi:MAG: glycine cleavage system protein GcvH [Candidatus Omnitrophota bacterium]
MAEIKFSKSHEWAKVEGKTAVIGISDYAQSELGDIVFIDLPEVSHALKQFSRLGTVESTKAASEIYAPLSGKIIEVNTDLNNNPQWINESSYDKGWIVKIEIEDAGELQALMDEAEYEEFIKQETH